MGTSQGEELNLEHILAKAMTEGTETRSMVTKESVIGGQAFDCYHLFIILDFRPGFQALRR
jgi:hypothetical protein